jgi:hypothetical protein
MKKIAFTFILVAFTAGMLTPTAAAEQLHSTVTSWTPNDVQPGEPVRVVLQLYVDAGSHYPRDGKPVPGVNDVEVVIYGEGETRRFDTEDVGGGHYSTSLIFPERGGWDLRVRYASGSYGPGDEILLGKGAICVGGELCVEPKPGQTPPAQGEGFPWMPLAVAALLAVVLVGAGAVGARQLRSRRRLTRAV